MAALSAPFANKELNGEQLLEELAALRVALVHQRHLNACADAIAALHEAPVAVAREGFRRHANGKFHREPALAGLLEAYAEKLNLDADVPLACSHFRRLALTSAILGALWHTERQRVGMRGRDG